MGVCWLLIVGLYVFFYLLWIYVMSSLTPLKELGWNEDLWFVFHDVCVLGVISHCKQHKLKLYTTGLKGKTHFKRLTLK